MTQTFCVLLPEKSNEFVQKGPERLQASQISKMAAKILKYDERGLGRE